MDMTQSVPFSLVVETVLIIFAVIGIGIWAVQRAKKRKEES